jgi:putative ABC transport system ATP-binding protein
MARFCMVGKNMGKEETVLKAVDVFKVYHMGASEVSAVSGVNLEIEQGEFVSIMGPSGSGKTTLLDILSCISRPSSGEVFIKGKPISEMNDSQLALIRGKTIGFVFQTFNLIGRLTAIENVAMPLWFRGMPEAERNEIAEKKLESVGLGHRLSHHPNELSGGERQRVAIARALAVDPDIIVADEPTGNLDSKAGKQLLGIINGLHEKENKTIIMVTHDSTVGALAERMLNLLDGKIISEKMLKKNRG